jgi:integral membrane sensor domain MASE1
MNFFLGVIFGIVLATVGAQGVARWVDKGVGAVKTQAIHFNK